MSRKAVLPKMGVATVGGGYGAFPEREQKKYGRRPKLLESIWVKGKKTPLIFLAVAPVEALGIQDRVVMVNKKNGHLIERAFKESGKEEFHFLVQPDGTIPGPGGQPVKNNGPLVAILKAADWLESVGCTDMVVNAGDMGNWKTWIWAQLIKAHLQVRSMFSMVTTMRRQTPELAELERYSRVIKNGDNMIARIVPLSDPSITGTELSQPLVDPFLYAFNIRWLKETGKLVEPTEKGERHPYQFAEIAYLDGCPAVEVYCDDSRQAFGVNTREELLKMRQMWAKR